MMLDWLGEKRSLAACRRGAAAIEGAIDRTLAEPATRTADLGGPLGTQAFAEAVAATLEAGA